MHTTLSQIKEYRPCKDGLKILLKYLDKIKCDDEPLLLSTIYKSNGFNDTAWCLRTVKSHNKELRKLACDFALEVKHLWDMPAIVEEYLLTQNKSIRKKARAAMTHATDAAVRAATGDDAAYSAYSAADHAVYASYFDSVGIQLKLDKILIDFIAEMEAENAHDIE